MAPVKPVPVIVTRVPPAAVAPVGEIAVTVGGRGRFTTVTLKRALAELPAASVAMTLTTVVPSGKTVSLAGEWNSAITPTASVAVAVVKCTVAPLAPVAENVWSAGTVITGLTVSATITAKVAVWRLPAVSVAVTATRVVPSGKTVSLAGR